MSLFQKTVIDNYLSKVKDEDFDTNWNTFKDYYLKEDTQERIKLKKEEEFQHDFLEFIFDNCLDYNIKDSADQNLFKEVKNVTDSKKADGAIRQGEDIVAVIELKSIKTKDFNEIQKQAFGYKNNHPNCKYVVSSNFQKLRFYIDDATKFEEFDLFKLNKEEFKLLWVCLAKDNLFDGVAKKLKSESILEEESITKKLYKDYSEFRKEIFNNLVESNTEIDKLTLFKKTQKLLDRFLFIFFAEDRGLVPTNSISKIIDQWEDSFTGSDSLYTVFKQYFNLLNEGRPKRGDKEAIYPYNGGLFADDQVLNTIKIDDDLLFKHTKNLSHYDFRSEISVDILGHIFEHSLSEIEEIQKEIGGEEVEKSKRKKDGIFYTPAYITKYMVENTIGKLCDEKKKELEINEENYSDPKRRSKVRIENIDSYREWLLDLKICDPACGSGAFLNQALNFLIVEHNYIDSLKNSYLGGSIPFSDIENSILENNLYGVDINEESVEIAKLSLWLRTAQKERKLTSLSNNIKCGNSLIDDESIAGEKAFKWEVEFPLVFAKGGFDVIIGNPPYVKARDNENPKERKFIEEKYHSPYKMWDLYVPFVEIGLNLLNKNGLSSMIIPDTIGKSDYTQKLIEIIESDYYLYQINFFPDISVFQNVGVRSKIIFIKNEKNSDPALKVKHIGDVYNVEEFLSKSKGDNQYLLEVADFELNTKNCITLGDICYVSYGMRLNSDKSDPEKFKKTDLLSNERDEIHNKIYTEGKYLENYLIKKNLFLEYDTERSPGRLVRPTFPELYPPSKILMSRQKKVAAISYEGHYCDNTIIMAILAFELESVSNKSISKYYKNIHKDRRDIEQNSMLFKLEYLIGIINSSLINYYIKYAGKGNIDFYPDDWKSVPIYNIDKTGQLKIVSDVNSINEKEKKLEDCKANFVELIYSRFSLNSISKKLEAWDDLSLEGFVSELEKNRKTNMKSIGKDYLKLSLSDQSEWIQYMKEEQVKVTDLKDEIRILKKKIDGQVYDLYGLTKEEIEIIENS